MSWIVISIGNKLDHKQGFGNVVLMISSATLRHEHSQQMHMWDQFFAESNTAYAILQC